MKRLLALALATAVAAGSLGVVPAEAYTDSSLGSNKLGRVGNATKTVYTGGELELEVRKGVKMKDSNIKWSIGNTKILRFEDNDRYDDEIEVKALKAGTTKVVAKNLKTGGKIYYTVKVKSPKATLSRSGNASRSVKVGDEFEVRVKKNGPISDSKIYWTTTNSSVVKIVDDKYDDEVEVKALKAGSAKIVAKNLITGGKIYYKVTVKAGSNKLARVGSATKTVEVGDDIEVSVKKNGLANSQIKWYIVDSDKLAFEEDRYGSSAEFEARRTGTAKVYAKNLLTGGKIYYKIEIVPDYDDDWDDDYDDEWDD